MPVLLRARFTSQAGATVEFDSDAEWRWEQPERVYRTAEEPPVLESIRHHWSLIGGAILTPDGSTGGGWSRFRAALLALNGSSDPIVKVELLRVEAGVETVEATLGDDGADTFEAFTIERLSCDGAWQVAPRATHKIAFPIDLRFSARQVFERDLELSDGTAVAGVVHFEQRIRHEYDAAGLGTITAETIVGTKNGVDARTRARLLGKLALPGSTWSYDTNGPDGVDLETLDADESTDTSRLPRSASAISRVRQWGEATGATSPNTAPGGYSYEDARSDDGMEILRVVSAEATGPGAEAWVRGRAPSSPHVEETVSKPTSRQFRATWTIRTPKNGQAYVIIDADITGGAEDFDFEPVNGFAPVLFEGALLPWQLTLRVSIQRRGGNGTKAELPLPPLLQDVWRLDKNASTEGWPRQEEQVPQPTNARWLRNAVLVYQAAVPPNSDPIEFLRANAQATVPSYYLKK
jgi:hypothetical protein